MPEHEHDHGSVLDHAREELSQIFEESTQCVYLYLDDVNKACNKKFAHLLGYKSTEEWAAVKESFPETFVAPKDRQRLVSTYQKAMTSFAGSTVKIAWRKKTGEEVPSTTILVPFVSHGHPMALHFIEPE
jgi:PAS domain S-box-containing protein